MGPRQRAVAAVKEGAALMQLLPRSQRTRSSGRQARQKANNPAAQYDFAFLDQDSVYLLAHRAETDQ
jgi:hypothetical protein